MPPTPEDPHALVGAYVMDALTDNERRNFERHLASCNACTQEVQELRAAAARLGQASATEPPPELWERVRGAIATTPQLPSATAHRTPTGARPRSRVLLAAAALLAVIAAGLGAWNIVLHDELSKVDEPTERVAAVLAAPDATRHTKHVGPSGTATVVVSDSRNAAVFVASQLPDPPPGRTYQLWLITATGPHPAGLLPDPSAVSLLDARLAAASQVALTLEPEGGSPQPTTSPVLVVNLTA